MQVCLCVCVLLCSHFLCTHVSPGEISGFEWSRHTKAAASLQAQGQTHCLGNDRRLPHTQLQGWLHCGLDIWKHGPLQMNREEGVTLENHHLWCMVLCDVPIKEHHSYKWSNLDLPVIRRTPVWTLWSKRPWSSDTSFFWATFIKMPLCKAMTTNCYTADCTIIWRKTMIFCNDCVTAAAKQCNDS